MVTPCLCACVSVRCACVLWCVCVSDMKTNLKSLVIKNCGWLGNEVGYLCMYRNSEHIPILNGSLGAWENEAEIQLGGKFSLVIKS